MLKSLLFDLKKLKKIPVTTYQLCMSNSVGFHHQQNMTLQDWYIYQDVMVKLNLTKLKRIN